MIYLSAFSDEASKELSGQIAALKRNGISFTELRGINGKNVKDFTVKEAEEYARTLAGEGIKVYSVGSPLGKADINVNLNTYMEEVKHVLELAHVFCAQRIRVFSFFNAYSQREKVFEYLNEMVRESNKSGITLCHENEKEVYGDTLERVTDIMQNVEGIKIVYDPANFVQVGEDAGVTYAALGDKAEYFHIKDVIKSTDELVPAGYGDGKIRELINGVKGDKVLTLEPHLAVFEGYSSIDNTVMKNKFKFDDNFAAFDFAAKSLKELLTKAGYKEKNGAFEKEETL